MSKEVEDYLRLKYHTASHEFLEKEWDFTRGLEWFAHPRGGNIGEIALRIGLGDNEEYSFQLKDLSSFLKMIYAEVNLSKTEADFYFDIAFNPNVRAEPNTNKTIKVIILDPEKGASSGWGEATVDKEKIVANDFKIYGIRTFLKTASNDLNAIMESSTDYDKRKTVYQLLFCINKISEAMEGSNLDQHAFNYMKYLSNKRAPSNIVSATARTEEMGSLGTGRAAGQ